MPDQPKGVRSLKIDLVSEHASPLADPGGPDAGGQNVHVRELAGALARQGHDVTVWTRRDSAEPPDVVDLMRGLRVRHMAAGPPRPIPKDGLVEHIPAMAAVLRSAWEIERPDVVHSHFWMSGLATLSAARGLRIPIVQTFHALGTVKRRHQGRDDTSPQGRIAAERVIARSVETVIATCDDEVAELTRMGAPRGRTAVVPCGVDLDVFTPEGPVAQRGRRPRFITVGRLVRRKGVDEAVAAMCGVPGAELLVAGGTGPRDPDLERLRSLAETHGVADRVRLLGPVARAELPALIRSADAVVCVPWYEPFGMVALEAMACGRPVVASAVGGLTDTVIDRMTGIHIPPRDHRALATALRSLLRSPILAHAYGVAGRDRAIARYSWDRVAAETALQYSRLVPAVTGRLASVAT